MSKTLIQGIAQNLFNKTDDELAGLFGETEDAQIDESKAIEFFKNELAAKVKSVTENQLLRGRKEAHKTWEDVLKSRATAREIQLSSDLKGEALFDAFLESITPQSGVKVDELTPDELKKHKAFQSVLDGEVKSLRQLLADKDQALQTERNSNLIRQNKDITVKSVFAGLDAAKWKKGETDDEISKREAAINDLLALYTGNFSQVKPSPDGKKIYFIDQDGEYKKDDLQEPIDVVKFILEKQPFGTHTFDPNKGSSGANSGKNNNNGGGYTVIEGVSLEKALEGVTDLEKSSEILRAYAEKMK